MGEELIAGYFHGRALRDVLGEIGGGTLQQVLATGVLMLLTLIPYFTYRLLGVRLGEGVLWKLLTERASAASAIAIPIGTSDATAAAPPSPRR
jgi:hypothetical protein